ncbi:MAG: porin family protein [Paludibacteraceae bacterium]
MKRRYFFIIPLCLFAFFVNAQETKEGDSGSKVLPVYRIEAGYSQIQRYGTYVSPTSFRVVRLGGSVEFPLQYNVGITAGLNYDYGFGEKTQYFVAPKDTASYSYSNHTLNIPVRVTYTLPVFWGFKLFGYAGPNFSVGLSQPVSLTSSQGTSWIEAGDYNAYKDKINRFDIQLGAGGGLQWRTFRLKSGYDWGLLNIGKEKGASQHNRGWVVSLEYEF